MFSGHLLDRLQSILNAAARLVFSARRSERITPLLRDLHWLRVPEPIQFRLCVLAFRRSGLAVACLTAVREVLGSNRAVGSCVNRKNHCDLQPWARAVRTLLAVPRSTQRSTLRETVNEYKLSG